MACLRESTFRIGLRLPCQFIDFHSLLRFVGHEQRACDAFDSYFLIVTSLADFFFLDDFYIFIGVFWWIVIVRKLVCWACFDCRLKASPDSEKFVFTHFF